MKAGYLALAAAIANGVNGKHAARRHAHEVFHMERQVNLTTAEPAAPSCGCTTTYTTITGAGTLYFPPPLATANSSTPAPAPTTTSTSTTTQFYTSTVYPSPVVPTPLATTCPTPGVYTIPATTVTLTESTTVCGAASTSVPAGNHTAGGITTTVTESTTVTCPYASVSTSGTVVTSLILTTTYICPSAGTYTIVPQTTVCEIATVWVYPTPVSYAPGTYTQPEVVATVTETDYVIFCPFTSEAPAPVAATSASVVVPVVAVPVTNAAAITTSAAPVVVPVVAALTTSAAPVVVASTSAAVPVATSSTSSSSGSLGNSGNQWAITYTPYTNTGGCKDETSVAADVAAIAAAGFITIRVYSCDCSTLEFVGAACETYGLKLILGVFINDSGCSGAQPQVDAITAWAKWELVELIVIGNEAVFNGYASAGDLASFISSAQTEFGNAGYTGPCTTTEPLDIWQANVEVLCHVVTVVGCNVHPFFNADVDADHAGSFISGQLEIIDTICSGITGIILETGWPSAGTGCNGLACPGVSQQATAVAGIKDAVGGRAAMFSYTNDLWKAAGDFGCEQSWGLIQLYQ